MEVLYPLIFFALIGFGTIALCSLTVPPAERGFVVRVLCLALTLRMIAATLFATFPETRIFHEDAGGYEYLGMATARGWSGTGPPIDIVKKTAPNFGFYYLSAVIYYVLGQFAPLVSYFNCVAGMGTVFLVYRLARQFFHVLVAKRAALLAAVVPSMVLWSSTAGKDTLMSLLILIGLSSCVAVKRRATPGAVLGIALSLLAMQPVRFYMVYFLGFAILTSLFLERGVGLVSGISKQILVAGILVGLLVMVGFAGSAQTGLDSISFERVSSFRHGMAITASSGFASDADVSTPGKALLFLPIGLAELLLGPFPWQFGSLRALLAAPETIYWWMLFPAMLRGMWWMFRKRFAETSPLLLFAVTMTSAYSLMHGNVGSGFRQRAQIFIILFIFASLGVFRSRCRRAGLDPDLLLNDTPRPPEPAPAATRAATDARAVRA
jgi:hypothetical protein